MIAALVAILAAIATPSPSPASTPAPVVWQGVTLGESISAVLARLGQPDSRRKAIMGTTLYEFKALDGGGTLSLTESAGIVTGIRLVAADPATLPKPVTDPFGVALGDTTDRLTELRGQPQRYDDEGSGDFTSYYGRQSEVRWAYGLHDGTIQSIGVILPYRIVRASGAAVAVATPRPPGAPTPPPPDASGMDRAIKVTPEALAADPQFEYTFVRAVACGAADHFSPANETIFNARRRNFSRIDAVCGSTGETRSFYFDITLVFGRADR
jgi:hypothetical protein